MASPVEIPRRNSRFDQSGKSTPQAPTPVTLLTPVPVSSVDFDTFMKAFAQYGQSLVEAATIHVRWDALKYDEQQQISEHDRWSKYSAKYVAIDEDQARGLKATESAKEEAHKKLKQAQEEGEKAGLTIAKAIFAATTGRSVSDMGFGALGPVRKQSADNAADLKEEIAVLKQEIADLRKRQDRQMNDLQRDYPSNKSVREMEKRLENRLSKEADRITSVAKIANDSKDSKRDFHKMEDKQLQSTIRSEVQNLGSSLNARLRSQQEGFRSDIQAMQAKEIGSCRSNLKAEFEKLCDTLSIRFNSELESRTSEVKSGTERLEQLVSINTSAIAGLEPQLSSFGDCVDSFAGFRNTVEHTIQNLKRESATQEQTIHKLEAEQQAQDSSVKGLIKRLDDTLSIQTVSDDIQQRVDDCIQENDQFRIEQKSMKAQMDQQTSLTEQLREQLLVTPSKYTSTPTPSDGITSPVASSIPRLEDDIEKRYRLLSRKLDERQRAEDERDRFVKEYIDEMNDVNIVLKDELSQLAAEVGEVKMLHEQRHRDDTLLKQLNQVQFEQSSYTNFVEQLQAEVKTLGADTRGQAEKCAQLCTTVERLLADIQALSNTVQGNTNNVSELDQIRTANSTTSANVKRLKADVLKLDETVGSCAERLLQLEHLQSGIQGPEWQSKSLMQRPTQLSAESPRDNGFSMAQEDEVKPKLEALGIKVDYFENQMTDKVKAMESFLASQEARFNNLTTEPMVRSVVSHIQQMYPLPALSRRQDQVEAHCQQLLHERETSDRKVIEVEKSVLSLRDLVKDSLRASFEEVRQEIRVVLQHIENFKLEMNQKLRELEQRITTNPESTIVQPDTTTRTLTKEYSNEHVISLEAEFDQLKKQVDKVSYSNEHVISLQAEFDQFKKKLDKVSDIDAKYQELQINLDSVKKDMEEDRTSFYKAQRDAHTATEELKKAFDASGKKIDAWAQDHAQAIESLRRESDGSKEKDARTQKIGQDIESLQRDLSDLKSKVESGAENLATEIGSLAQKVEDSGKKADAACKRVNEVYDTALTQLVGLDTRVRDLQEAADAISKGDQVPAVVGETPQNNEVGEISSESDRDANPIRPKPKRSRDSPSLNGSVERPPMKKKRGPRHNLDTDDDDEYSEHSSNTPLGSATRRSARNLSQHISQQLESPPSRPSKPGRPRKNRND
ncbi:MAG: hypothetical protein L6R40_005503 [Gallowayella cf. fulva]|nr:MAG: hypothetical protein L6R40_005503 [Xanthomendoza cf. fulva]